ncbi:restriction endonuclease subunit S [Nostoc sp.]|uniref:restriction endonuclease subunit S n=1 Tax=Nostoc sp. TaxID=1180 RepID=UPI002FFA97FB
MGEMQMPPHWKVVKLGEYCEKPEYGYTASATKQDSGYKFLRITDIQDGTVQWNNVPSCEVDKIKIDKYILFTGDIVVARIGATTGKSFLIDDCPQAIFASYLIRIRTKHDLLPRFLNFYFETETYWQQIDAKKGGKLKGGVNIPIIKNLLVPLPPLLEQKTIAHTLQTIQKAKETCQRELELERERKAALMQYLFTHGTNPEFNTFQKTRFGKAPQHWKIVPLEKCAFIQTGTAKGRKFQDSETVILPYLRVANVQDGYLDLSEIKEISIRKSEVKRYSLEVNDVVLTEGGDPDKLGRGFIWEGQIPNCIHQNHIFAVRTNREILLPEYLAYLVQSDYGKAYFLSVAHRTTNLASINSTKLKAFPTLVPDISEQKRILTILQICDRKIQALEKEIALTDELFHAMLEQLMTGKISTQPLTETYV